MDNKNNETSAGSCTGFLENVNPNTGEIHIKINCKTSAFQTLANQGNKAGQSGTLPDPTNLVKYYMDRATGAEKNLSLWKPTVNESQLILGHKAVGNHSDLAPKGIMPVADKGQLGYLFKHPDDFTEIYNDKGSRGNINFSVWQPTIKDENYVCLADIGKIGYDKPDTKQFACIHKKCAVDASLGNEIYNDRKSGAQKNLSIWQVVGSDFFVANSSYEKPTKKVYYLDQKCIPK